jgi:NADH-ubiquinone oxidoreductase chain 5
VVTIVGSLTAFFAASVGLVQNDLKRVIAYSTCSQLGYMVFSCGLSHYSIAFFHLVNHAFFKALLFLSAGSIIHGLSDEQDLRKMGSLVKFFPVSYVMILIGSLALTGFPFFTGFYSKDLILETAFSSYSFMGNFAFVLGNLAALFTSFYSFRLLFLTFINYSNSYRSYVQNSHEGSLTLLFPLFCLCFGSIFFGFLAKDLFSGLGTSTFNDSIHCQINNASLINSEFISPFFKNVPLFCTLIGFILSFLFINGSFINKNVMFNFKMTLTSFYCFLSKKWHFDQIFNELVVHKIMNFGYGITFQLIDKGNIEMIGPKSVSSQFNKISTHAFSFHSGLLYEYLFIMVCFALLFFSLSFSFLYFPFFSQNIIVFSLIALSYTFFK